MSLSFRYIFKSMYNLCMDEPRMVSTHLQKVIAKEDMFSHLHLFDLQPVVVK